MMAASARTSGTTLPLSSNLKRGSIASRSAAAWMAARVRAALTRRVVAAGFFAVTAVVVFRTAGFFAVATVFLWAVVVAALDCAGTPMVAAATRKQNRREAAANRLRITGKPLRPKLLRYVSAL